MSMCAMAVTNADGSIGLQLQPLQTDLSQCQFVILSGSESGGYQLLNMQPADALIILSYVVLAFATAWGFRQIKKSLADISDLDPN